MKKLTLSESERKHILGMYGILHEDDRRPINKLMECRFTSDGKYVVYQDKSYSCETGEQVPLNEEWTLSDILHTGADILSAGLDFVIPGSGAVVDVLNAISYIIEAQFKNDEEKDSLYIMAIITFAFVIIPGPLQAISIPLKRAVKTGAGMASKVVVQGLKIIGESIDTLLIGIPSKINAALKSPLAKNILGKWGDKISGFIGNFTSRIKQLLNKVTGKTGKEGTEIAGKKTTKEVSGNILQTNFTLKNCNSSNFCDTQNIIKRLFTVAPTDKIFNPSKIKVIQKSNVAGREVIETQLENGQKVLFYKSSGQNVGTTGKEAGEWFIIPGFAKNGWFVKTKETIALTKGGNKYLTEMSQFLQKNGVEGLSKSVVKQTAKTTAKSTLTKITKTSLRNFFRVMPKISKGSFVLRKLGFVVGKPYKYVGKSGKAMTATIKEITDNGLKVAFKNGTTTMIPVETFIKNAVGAPWMRRGYSVTVPLFIKRFSDFILPDGNIDYTKIEQLPDLDPNVTSQESMEYLQEEVASYEGDKGSYSINSNVETIQNALLQLGFKLPRFGADGKFGPETQAVLKQFQDQNNLTSSLGKIDRVTTRKLSELLKSNNVQGSEELQTTLNKI
jgi:hypothetical protein